MKVNKKLIEIVLRFGIAALSAALTAIGTTSCMGLGPVNF